MQNLIPWAVATHIFKNEQILCHKLKQAFFWFWGRSEMSLRTRYRRALRLVVVWMGRMMHTRNFSMAFSRFLSELSPAVNMLNILICVVCYMQVLEAQVSGCTSVSHTNLQRSTTCKVYTSSQYVKYQGIVSSFCWKILLHLWAWKFYKNGLIKPRDILTHQHLKLSLACINKRSINLPDKIPP